MYVEQVRVLYKEREGEVKMEKGIGFQIRSLSRMIRRKLDATIASIDEVDLTGIQNAVLSFITEEQQVKHRDVFQRDVEKHFEIRRSTATAILQRLEKDGYLIRESVPGDARLKRIVLTEKAEQTQKILCKIIREFDAGIVAGFSEEELETLVALLGRIRKNIE